LPFVFSYGALKSQYNKHFLSVCYPKYLILAGGIWGALGKIMFSGRRVGNIIFGSLSTASKGSSILPKRRGWHLGQELSRFHPSYPPQYISCRARKGKEANHTSLH
jgi:hypothetical protein